MRTSPMIAYLGRKFLNVCEPIAPMIRGHLYLVAVADQYAMVLMALLARAFPPREFSVQDFPEYYARIHVGSYNGIMCPLPQHADEFVRDIKVQGLIEWTRFDSVLPLLRIRRFKGSNWVVEGCLRLNHFEFRTEVVRGVPAYWRHE